MAFFNELGKKISQAGQSAVQKTKDLTDIARINSLISDEEKRISSCYHQIGMQYVATHQNDFEDGFSELIVSLRDAENKIKEYKQQILVIKGVTNCAQCGAEVTNDVAFCSSCGAKMPVKTTDSSKTEFVNCPDCGTALDPKMRFCTSCGKMVQTDAASETLPVTEHSITEKTENKCPNCGVENLGDSSFCTECGTKLN